MSKLGIETNARRCCRGLWMLAAIAALGCNESKTGGDDPTSAPLGAYKDGDPCHESTEADSCNATKGCGWVEADFVCAPGEKCPEGFCSALDACALYEDADSCQGDKACDWADLSVGPTCASKGCSDNRGVCFSRGDGGGDDCLCACPAYCPEGAEDCGTCDCKCPDPMDDGGGGGTCTCAVAPCVSGEYCPPQDCKCDGSGGGGGDECGGTCTCACPACEAGEKCEPCDCDCGSTMPGGGGGATPAEEPSEGGGEGMSGPGTEVCVCAACEKGGDCPPCKCGDDMPSEDPCSAHADAEECSADSANECNWYGFGKPCMEGEPCVSGVCQGPSLDPCADHTDDKSCGADTGNDCQWINVGMPCAPDEDCRSGVCQMVPPDDGCVCACPACAPDESCAPCDCDCGGNDGCDKPVSSDNPPGSEPGGEPGNPGK